MLLYIRIKVWVNKPALWSRCSGLKAPSGSLRSRRSSSLYSAIVRSNSSKISSAATVSRWLTEALSAWSEDIFRHSSFSSSHTLKFWIGVVAVMCAVFLTQAAWTQSREETTCEVIKKAGMVEHKTQASLPLVTFQLLYCINNMCVFYLSLAIILLFPDVHCYKCGWVHMTTMQWPGKDRRREMQLTSRECSFQMKQRGKTAAYIERATALWLAHPLLTPMGVIKEERAGRSGTPPHPPLTPSSSVVHLNIGYDFRPYCVFFLHHKIIFNENPCADNRHTNRQTHKTVLPTLDIVRQTLWNTVCYKFFIISANILHELLSIFE